MHPRSIMTPNLTPIRVRYIVGLICTVGMTLNRTMGWSAPLGMNCTMKWSNPTINLIPIKINYGAPNNSNVVLWKNSSHWWKVRPTLWVWMKKKKKPWFLWNQSSWQHANSANWSCVTPCLPVWSWNDHYSSSLSLWLTSYNYQMIYVMIFMGSNIRYL